MRYAVVPHVQVKNHLAQNYNVVLCHHSGSRANVPVLCGKCTWLKQAERCKYTCVTSATAKFILFYEEIKSFLTAFGSRRVVKTGSKSSDTCVLVFEAVHLTLLPPAEVFLHLNFHSLIGNVQLHHASLGSFVIGWGRRMHFCGWGWGGLNIHEENMCDRPCEIKCSGSFQRFIVQL